MGSLLWAYTLNWMPLGKRLSAPSSVTVRPWPEAEPVRANESTSAASSAARSEARRLVANGSLLVGAEQWIQLPIEDGFGIAGLIAGAVVLHHLVRVEDVRADLVSPGGGDVPPLQARLFLRPLLQLPFQEPRLQHLERALLVAVLGALILAGDGEAAGDVRDADGGGVLLDVLAALAG